MNSVIATVRGPLDPVDLGAVNYHEHAFQVSPLLLGDELDDEARSTQEFELLRGSGFDGVVDATPFGLGRHPRALQRLARQTGLHIIATTGMHREAHYVEGHPARSYSVEALATMFSRDLSEGMPERDSPDSALTDIRAGVLKAGIGYWSISSFERRVLDAVAISHTASDAPVMIHLESGSATHELLDLLELQGVPAGRVALAHMDRNPDPGLHSSLAERGAFLGYDGMARTKVHPESVLIDLTASVVNSGHSDRICCGDVARRSRYVAYGGMPDSLISENDTCRVYGCDRT